MAIVNQSIAREPLKVVPYTQNQSQMKCLDSLPKPILIDTEKAV